MSERSSVFNLINPHYSILLVPVLLLLVHPETIYSKFSYFNLCKNIFLFLVVFNTRPLMPFDVLFWHLVNAKNMVYPYFRICLWTYPTVICILQKTYVFLQFLNILLQITEWMRIENRPCNKNSPLWI